MQRFDGKTVLVTGASSGIGRACAVRLAAQGANLVLVGRSEERLQEVAPESGAVVHRCDLSAEPDIQALVDRLKADVGPIQGWIFAAGAHALRPVVLESYDSLQLMWLTNVISTLRILTSAYRERVVPRGASIVLFSSAAARAGGAGQVAYAMTKGAVGAMVRSLAVEWASHRIRVNAVAPGVVKTPMTDRFFAKLGEEQIGRLESHHPLGFGRAEEVAAPVLFLLSDEASWITGSVIAVDGGFSVS